jgi:hypothetical protein
MQAHRTLTVVFWLGFFAIAACSNDSTGPKIPEHVGTYGLALVNGGGLPATIFQNSAGRITIPSGSLVLRADGSYHETINLSTVFFASGVTENDVANEDGTYSVVGSQITFTIPPSGTASAFSYTGAVSGNNLTYTYNGRSYAYVKTQ